MADIFSISLVSAVVLIAYWIVLNSLTEHPDHGRVGN